MDEMPPALALPPQVGSSLCDSPVEGARRKRSAETQDLPSNPMLAPGSGSAADVEQTEVMAPVTAALEEDGDDLEVRTIPGSDEEDPSSIEPEMSAGSPSSVVSDSSNLSCAIDEFSISDSSAEVGTPSSMDAGTVHGNAVRGPASWELGVNPLPVSMNVTTPSVIELGNPENSRSGDGSHLRSLFLMERLPLWGFITICGRRPEMEDAVVVVPYFFEVPLWMLIGDQSMDGLDPDVIRIPLHFFGVYDGHGGAQVANYCRERLHLVLMEQLEILAKHLGGTSRNDWKKHWEKAFVDCFQKVDDQVGGKESRGNMGSTAEAQSEGDMLCPNILIEAVAPETVGSTAVVAVVCSSHIIIANCGDSRAVLCRGKQPIPLSVDHKPNREDEYARIEAQGGKVIQWNGYRVFGVLAMSRSIGDRYLKPWIIPEPEVMIVPRAREDECLILASDGLWDVMSDEEVCDVARRRILLWHKKNGPVSAATQRGEGTDPAAQAAAECLSRLAVQKGSKDNITIIVVDLKAQRKFKSKSEHARISRLKEEKYGPKDQGKASQKAQEKPDKPKPNADVDVNVGLSSRPPWFCSLCNTNTTSKQTLLLHADGKKHRAKARAFHAAQKQSTQTVEPTSNTEIADGKPSAKSIESNGFLKADESRDEETAKLVAEVENESSVKRKRKNDVIEDFAKDNEKNVHDLSNGEVIQARETGAEGQPNKKKHVEDHHDKQCHSKEFPQHKIKWKKLVTSTLKMNPDLTMKVKKLQKIVIKMVNESGVTQDEAQLRGMLMNKINSSSRFVVDNKKIQLVIKAKDC